MWHMMICTRCMSRELHLRTLSGSSLSLQETGESTRAKTLVDKAEAVVDNLSTMAWPYLRRF
jgi:hypothetical protein